MPNLSQETMESLEKRMEKQKEQIEKDLSKFASKDPDSEGDWDSKYPKLDANENVDLEREADEVEEYTTRVSVEHSLEKHLEDINLALEKIKKKKYGICENCGKDIPLKRLKIYPEARYCIACNQKGPV